MHLSLSPQAYPSPLRSFLLSGTIGHVAHGKSTVVKAISGVLTVRFKNELERNITIKLGYANAKVSTPATRLRYEGRTARSAWRDIGWGRWTETSRTSHLGYSPMPRLHKGT